MVTSDGTGFSDCVAKGSADCTWVLSPEMHELVDALGGTDATLEGHAVVCQGNSPPVVDADSGPEKELEDEEQEDEAVGHMVMTSGDWIDVEVVTSAGFVKVDGVDGPGLVQTGRLVV